MAVGRSGYCGVVRLDRGRLNLAAAVDPDCLKRKSTPAAAVAELLLQAGLGLPSSFETGEWFGTAPLTRVSSSVAGERLLLLGDAAGYVEPFTGEGIAWALSLGAAVASVVKRGVADWDNSLERDWTECVRRRVLSRQWFCRRIASLLRHPWGVRCALAVLARAPSLATPILNRVSQGPSGS